MSDGHQENSQNDIKQRVPKHEFHLQGVSEVNQTLTSRWMKEKFLLKIYKIDAVMKMITNRP